MKRLPIVLAGGLAIAAPAVSTAQTPLPLLVRADVAGSVGWLNAEHVLHRSGSDWHSSAIGTAMGGWYWTDSLKTELEAAITSRGSVYDYWTDYVDRQYVYHAVRAAHSTKRAAISQQYQFFRNAWFHPYVGAGLDLTWESIEREHQTNYPYNPAAGLPRRSDERTVSRDAADFDLKPFTLIGYKAYLSPRVFFRNDLRLTFDSGVEEVLLRFGLGVDITPRRHK